MPDCAWPCQVADYARCLTVHGAWPCQASGRVWCLAVFGA